MSEATVMITTHNSYHYLRRLLESMDYFDPGCKYDLFIADNASEDGTALELINEFGKRKEFRRLQLNKDNLWDHLVYNSWMESVMTDHVLFLNSDIRVLKEDWLSSMIGEEIFERERRQEGELSLLGCYAAECEKILPPNLNEQGEPITPTNPSCPHNLEWVLRLWKQQMGDAPFDHLGHMHQSMFFGRTELFKKAGPFRVPRVLTNRHENIAAELEFSVRLRSKGFHLVDSKEIRSHFYHFGQKFPMLNYPEIIQREKSLHLPEMRP